MPEAPVAEAPPVAAPSPSQRQVALSAPSSAPSNVAPNAITLPRQATMKDSLDSIKKLKRDQPPPLPEVAPKPTEAPSKPLEQSAPGAKIGEPTTDAAAAKTPETAKPTPEKTDGPKDWKLLNQIKAERDTLKRQLAEKSKADAESQGLAEKLASHQKELETIKNEKKQYEELIRFRDYQNHPEFIETYVKPWESAWSRATANLQGVKLVDETGNERDISKADIQALADMDIPTARATIKKMVPDGTDAAEVRAHVDGIRDATSKHKTALEKAWVDSEKWQKDQVAKQQQVHEERNRAFKTVTEENAALFRKFDDEDKGKIEFLKEKDGDDEWNERLNTAREFAKESLAGNPNNPELTSEQRAQMIRRNTAFINRSIAFPMLKLELNRVKAKLAEKEKLLAGYQATEPAAGNGKGKPSVSTAQVPTMESVVGGLRARFAGR